MVEIPVFADFHLPSVLDVETVNAALLMTMKPIYFLCRNDLAKPAKVAASFYSNSIDSRSSSA